MKQLYFDFGTNETGNVLEFNLDAVRRKDNQVLTHNLHPWPAKFIPYFPAKLISYYSAPGQVVLDPFCGSGTTLVEAMLSGRRAIGVDINPIAVLVSKAKTSILSEQDGLIIQDVQRSVLALMSDALKGKLPQNELPSFPNRDHWFKPFVSAELAALLKLFPNSEDTASSVLLRTVFSSIIVRVSNQESETRWKAVDKKVRPGDTLRLFLSRLTEAVERVRQFAQLVPPTSTCTVYRADSRNLGFIERNSIDLIVTSPPYLNSFDYYLYHKLRMFWLGYDHKEVQDKEIGSRHLHCDKGQDPEVFRAAMTLCLNELHRIVRPGGHVALVVGDSIYRGKLIDMAHMYSQIAHSIGFRLVFRFDYDQRKYTTAFTKNLQTQAKQGHVLVYKKL